MATRQRNRNIRSGPILTLFLVMIILLDFVNATITTSDKERHAKRIITDLHGICVADAVKLAKLQIGSSTNLDLKLLFPADTKSYSPHGYAVSIGIDINKDRIDAMLIYAYGKGDDTLRVGSWDSTSKFNWDVQCGSSIGQQNSTLVTVGGNPVTSTSLTWYPPYSGGFGSVSFKALAVNKDQGYEILTIGPLVDSTNSTVVTTSSAPATATSKKTSTATNTPSASNTSGYIPTAVSGVHRNDAKSNRNLDVSFIAAMILMVSLPVINIF